MKDYSQYTNLELVQYLLGDDYEKQVYRGTLAPLFFPKEAFCVNQEEVGAVGELIERWMKNGLLPALLSTPLLIREYLRVSFAAQKVEGLTALVLDAERQLIGTEELFRGVIAETTISIGQIVQRIMGRERISVLFVHHLPLGKAEPGTADIWLATHLKKVLTMLGIKIVDYVVVIGSEPISLTERGLL